MTYAMTYLIILWFLGGVIANALGDIRKTGEVLFVFLFWPFIAIFGIVVGIWETFRDWWEERK